MVRGGGEGQTGPDASKASVRRGTRPRWAAIACNRPARRAWRDPSRHCAEASLPRNGGIATRLGIPSASVGWDRWYEQNQQLRSRERPRLTVAW
jgi:hypothetical protein